MLRVPKCGWTPPSTLVLPTCWTFSASEEVQSCEDIEPIAMTISLPHKRPRIRQAARGLSNTFCPGIKRGLLGALRGKIGPV